MLCVHYIVKFIKVKNMGGGGEWLFKIMLLGD